MLSIVIFKDNDMFDTTAGMFLLLFFVWNGFQAVSVDMFEYTVRWYIQMGLSGIGGLVLVFPAISRFFTDMGNKAGVDIQTGTNDSKCSKIDYDHLLHLRSVMIKRGNLEGARLVSQINTILFNEPIKEIEKYLPVNESPSKEVVQ
jgi:hypothetical protein